MQVPLIMKNRELKPFVEFIMSIETNAKNSRMRSRFVKIASERLSELEEERINLLNKYVKRNENGEPIITVSEDGQNVYELNDADKCLSEYMEMMEEEFRLDEFPERKDMLLAIKDIVLNIPDEITFSGERAFEYDRWCEIVEGIQY